MYSGTANSRAGNAAVRDWYLKKPVMDSFRAFDMRTQKSLLENAGRLVEENRRLSDENAELVKQTKDKENFFQNVAHDLKSPFAGMLNLAKSLLYEYDKYDDAERKRTLKTVVNRGDSVYALLLNLLEWSRLHHEIALQKEKVDIKLCVDFAFVYYDNNAYAKKIRLVNDIAGAYAFADQKMVSQIIQNLVSNSIKFTPDGGYVKVYASEEGEFIKVIVDDNGKGIKPESIESILSPDRLLTTEGTKGEHGTGLGLKIVMGNVEKLGGKFWIESEGEGKGTKVSFTLPLAKQ